MFFFLFTFVVKIIREYFYRIKLFGFTSFFGNSNFCNLTANKNYSSNEISYDSNTNNNKYKIKNTVDQNEYNPPQEVIHEGDPENLGSENQNEDKSNVGSLMKLQYISVCQACKENFNSSVNVPYLLKCGHFFCRNCIIYGLTDEEGRINCPDDGIVANKLSELKLPQISPLFRKVRIFENHQTNS